MASYHRVLETFGRSIQDNTLECDWCVPLLFTFCGQRRYLGSGP